MANEVENLYFKKGSILNKSKLSNGDVGFALYYEGGETQKVPVAGTIYLKESDNLIPILPKSDIQGKVLCSQGENNPAEYLSNIILGHSSKIQGEDPNQFSIETEAGSIKMISKLGESILLQANNVFQVMNKTVQNVYLPFSTNLNYVNSYLIWSSTISTDNSVPVAGSPNWPIYVNNEGMVIKCNPILGTEEEPFDEIHNKKIILYGDNGTGYLNVADGLVLSDYEYGDTQIFGGGLWISSTDFQFNIQNEYSEIYYSLNNEECSIALYPADSGYRKFSNALELKGNICLSSDYSYSYDHPSEAVVNASDPYEGQIYFKLLD